MKLYRAYVPWDGKPRLAEVEAEETAAFYRFDKRDQDTHFRTHIPKGQAAQFGLFPTREAALTHFVERSVKARDDARAALEAAEEVLSQARAFAEQEGA